MTKELFTEEEVLSIREGIDGVKRVLPPRFYTDEDLFEVDKEKVLKRNWLCVGRWDQAENHGDYFTINMFGKSIIIVRNKEGGLHALFNVCQHRFSQIVDDGSGNAKSFMCPYHRWTYTIDGSLKGIAMQSIPGVDKKKCSLPSLRVEEWQGFIFVNYDQDAKPLGPQLAKLDPLFNRFGVSKFRIRGEAKYDVTWNYKCNLENGYEGYHHVGPHFDRIHHIIPSTNTKPLMFGDVFGSYTMWPVDSMPAAEKREFQLPFGPAPWMEEEKPEDLMDYFVDIYPTGPSMYLNSYQCSSLIIHPEGVDSGQGRNLQYFAPWVLDNPDNEGLIKEFTDMMVGVQDEDTYALTMWQKGLRSADGCTGLLHPLESQLNHYHNWYIDQMTKD